MSRIFSIGYADHTQESLVARLREAGVRVVADVRANPVSRKKGFSKNQLAAALDEAGIEYRSVRDLGIPTSDRKTATGGAAGWDNLLLEYARSLDDSGGTRSDSSQALADDCVATPTAVMCLESDLDHCHRKPLSEWIAARTALELTHL